MFVPGLVSPLQLLSAAELRRYGRHLVLPEVGVAGQQKLKRARVALVGLGGLGSPVALYLAAAGVGTLGLIDDDVVDESNLQRQVLYGQPEIGRSKLAAAMERLAALNPHVVLEPHGERLTSANALAVLGGYDLVVDGSDNFPTRYLVNDACVFLGKPDVYGSIFRFEGQVAVFWGARGPCYRCLFAEPPPPGLVPSCAEGGVLGVLPGVIGALQATEAIKCILGAGAALVGRLLAYDALAARVREVRVPKDPACPVCSEQPTIRELQDYEAFCGLTPTTVPAPQSSVEIGPLELRDRLAAGRPLALVDVREPWEAEIATLPQAQLVPLGSLAARLDELPRDRPLVVYCHLGVRSLHAVEFLRARGFSEAWSLAGGLDGWSSEVDSAVPRY
jgi:sulfur-carrier protein adenylyltransferase/sulfurtransferase